MKRFPRLLAIWMVPLALASTVEGRVCRIQYLAQYREVSPGPRPKLSSIRQKSAKIEIGTQLDFLVFGGRSSLRPATCRYVGEHCYIFVENTQWDTNGGFIYQADVDALGKLFEHSTPADPERGIYDLEVESFGPPPDVDGDERIFILITDTNGEVGFFDPRVAIDPDPALRRDVIHLDAWELRTRRFLALGTLAHEFQHLIHWGQDEDEETWINEGLSGYAEELTGFPESDPDMVPMFLAAPDLDLTDWPWEDKIPHYGATYLFMSFLAERYGSELLHTLVAEPRNGIQGINAAFAKFGQEQNFDGAWAQWIVGNYAADDPLYGYQALRGRRVRTSLVKPQDLPFEAIEGKVYRQWGTHTILFRTSGNIEVEFAGEENARFNLYGYVMRGGIGEAVEIELDEGNRGSIKAMAIDSLVIIVGKTPPQLSWTGSSFFLSAREFTNTVVSHRDSGLPLQLDLGTVYPNPFNGRALIPFQVPEAADLKLSLYNALGQRIRTLRQGMHGEGQYEVVWDGRGDDGSVAGSGTYLVVLQSGGTKLVQRLSLVR